MKRTPEQLKKHCENEKRRYLTLTDAQRERIREVNLKSYHRRKQLKGNTRSVPVPMLDRDALLYIAGLLDGEGCITIGRGHQRESSGEFRYAPAVKIVLTHEGAIRWVAEKLQRSYRHQKAREGTNRRDVYGVTIQDTRGVCCFLEQVLPFLIIKRDVAIAAIAFCKSRLANPKYNHGRTCTSAELQLYDDIRYFNRRGREAQGG